MTTPETDWRFASIRTLASGIRSGAVSPLELAELSLNELESTGQDLNAVVTLTPELARRQAQVAEDELAQGIDRGLLHGIPYGAKDLLATAGIPATWGAEPYRSQVFDQDAAVVNRLQEAGAVLVGKLAMVECAGGFGYDQPDAALTGPGRNAWSADHWAGGSSSGSGAAVGAGCVPFAIGTETWGSIVTPASFNGVSGFRPTYDTVSRDGAMALSWSMDKIGPLARSAEDCATVFDAVVDRGVFDVDRSLPRDGGSYRFGVLASGAEQAVPVVRQRFEESIEILRGLGSVEEISLPDLHLDEAASIIVMSEAASAFEDLIRSGRSHELTAPEDRVGLHHALTVPAVDYLRAQRIRRLGARALDDLLSGFAAIVAPTTGTTATPIDENFSAWFARDDGPTLGGAGNLCGLPSISVPNGFDDSGLPTGIEFLGRAYADYELLEVAIRFQDVTDWHLRHPG